MVPPWRSEIREYAQAAERLIASAITPDELTQEEHDLIVFYLEEVGARYRDLLHRRNPYPET